MTDAVGSSMKIASGRGKVSYEAHFQRPHFDIGANSAGTFDAIYASFSAVFPSLTLGDLSTVNGPPLAAANFAVNVLDGAATARIWLDHYSIDWNILRAPTTEDITTTLSIVACIEDAISRVAPDVVLRNANVQVAQWYLVSGDVAAWLQQHATLGGDELTKALGAERAEYSANVRVRNDSELWLANFAVEPSRVAPWQLFISYAGTYVHAGRYKSALAQSEHVNSLFAALFAKWGFETVEIAGSAP